MEKTMPDESNPMTTEEQSGLARIWGEFPGGRGLLDRSDAIRAEHDHWWRDPVALAKLKDLWGDAINDCGVFRLTENEVLFDSGGFKAELSISSVNDLYTFGCLFSHPHGGSSFAPSIDGDFFTSREAARSAAVESLLDRIPRSLPAPDEPKYCTLERIRQALRRTLTQRTLF